MRERSRPTLWQKMVLAFYYLVAKHLPSTSMPGGSVGNRSRAACARRLFEHCGPNVVVKRGAYFGDGRAVRLGANSQIGEGARITNDTVIGDDVMMGLEVLVLSVVHQYDDPTVPIIQQGYAPSRPVEIGDDVWIGARAIVLPGVRVGSHSVIGAGAVVATDVSEGTVVGGVPARLIKQRPAGE